MKKLPLATIVTLVFAASPSYAERPMTVDDAGTLDKGGAKVEFGWSRDDKARGWDAAAGFAPIDNLELELSYERLRDHDPDPTQKIRGTGFALKWVPLQEEVGLSAGLKLEIGRTRISDRLNPTETEHARSLNGLFTWGFASGQRIHANLGHEWVRMSGPNESVNTWGIGFEQPLVENVQLGIETFGANHMGPDKQVGLRWEVAEGLKLSIAAGHGNSRSFGNAGVAWEF
jgi:hypothetical protein